MAYQQGVLTDVVLDGNGKPVAGASVSLYSTINFVTGVLPTGVPGFGAGYSATTDATGTFSIRQVAPDDYHMLVQYTPAGGSQLTLWRYNVAIAPTGLSARAYRRGLSLGHRRTLAKLAARETLTICCVGDELTVGYNATGTVTGGWVARLATDLAQDPLLSAYRVTRYDPTSFGVTVDAAIPSWSATVLQAPPGLPPQLSVINAGVTGDTVLRVLRRLSNLNSSSWTPPPDCYIIALGVGEMTSADPTRSASVGDFYGHLVGLIDVLRQTGADVVLCTPPLGYGGMDPTPYVQAVLQAAAATGASVVDLHQLWLDHYDSLGSNLGYGTWLNSAAGNYTKPTDLGHQVIGDEVYKAFDTTSELPLLGGLGGVPLEMERLAVVNTDPLLTFTGSWATYAYTLGISSREMQSNTAGDTITFTARFTELALLGRRWHDGGQLTVTIDAALIGTVDLYRANPTSTVDTTTDGAIAPQERITLAVGQSDLVHSVTLRHITSTNPLTTGQLLRIDGLELVRVRRPESYLQSGAAAQRLVSGRVVVTLTSSAVGTAAVAFGVALGTVAQMVATAIDPNGDYVITLQAITAVGATVVCKHRDGTTVTANVTVCWLAVG